MDPTRTRKGPAPSDVVWYWLGGREKGEWLPADAGTRSAIRQGGRVAHDGLLAIGAPEGPPDEAEFRSVGADPRTLDGVYLNPPREGV